MSRYGLVCLLVVVMAVGRFAVAQKADPDPHPSPDNPASTSSGSTPASVPGAQPPPSTSVVPLDTPVITLHGICDATAAGKPASPDCKTVVTRADFDRIINLVMPNAPVGFRKHYAEDYARKLRAANQAEQEGLDKTDRFQSMMDVRRWAFGRIELQDKFVAEESAKITDKDVEDYYNRHPIEWVTLDLDRVFVPKMPRQQDSDPKLSDAEQQKRKQEWLDRLKQEAERLRLRALAGEDFLKLQKEAYVFVGLSSDEVDRETIELRKFRRVNFTEGQQPIMDVKVGEFSPLLIDQNGFFIFKVLAKGKYSLEKMKHEIRQTILDQHVKADWDALQRTVTTTYNDNYFGPEIEGDEEKTPVPAKSSPGENNR